jgi:acyl carrier protein
MTQQEKLDALAEVFEVESAELTPETALDTLTWDSMAMLSVIALANELCGKRMSGNQIKSFKTVGDILDAMA